MNKTNRLDLSINLVEDMVTRKGHFNNSCMVLEIRELMEKYIIRVTKGSKYFSSDGVSTRVGRGSLQILPRQA